MIKFTTENFEKEALESEIPVMIDFYADWCGPCKMIAPIVEELADEYKDTIKVGKLNIDDNPEIATRYAVMSIPTVLFFKEGEVINQVQGADRKSVV